MQETPDQETIGQIARQVSKLIRSDDGRGETAEEVTEVVEIAARTAVHIGEKQLSGFHSQAKAA